MSCPVCLDENSAPDVSLIPCGHKLCVICANQCRRIQNKCPLCRARIAHLKGGEAMSHGSSQQVWLYGSKKLKDTWWLYDDKRQKLLTHLFSSDPATKHLVDIGPMTFTFDFPAMTQTCTQTATVRPIKCVDDLNEVHNLKTRGVAGVSLWAQTHT